ncbi:PREDICTED: integrin alpha-9-like [Dinoponera quadriceps]|uniref:Integrin alpha-9-like n=1 Tax=Dinoponera quadriceps TaxID=609295 RepID=A0A6P3XRF9_DINQU|nr:PREDICTED: integrin alpha-9-like [Dinoponera quadriceps]
MAFHTRNVVVRPDDSGEPRTRHLVALLMILAVLICNLATVSAYNIDTNYPMLYPNEVANGADYRATNFARSYFGYSVLLFRDLKYNSTWLIVGAPRGNYTHPTRNQLRDLVEPGVVYWCHILGKCVPIEPAIVEDERIAIKSYNLNGRVIKDHSWFGAAISVEKTSNYLTICAPRTVMSITTFSKSVHTMHGMCYSNDVFKNVKVMSETSNIEYYDFSQQWWYDPLYGFSVTYAPSQSGNVVNRIIGAPNHVITGSVTMMRLTKSGFHVTYKETTNIPIFDSTSRFGYSTTAGYYFSPTQMLYASGDPSWNHMGQVAILDQNRRPFMVANISGSSTGEYFGASLASGDLNKDGLDDLVVGAPHWKNDNGRVHVYLGTRKGKFDASAILEGDNEDALFGYAVACGDLDKDGFSDIIVGAPWEESGAIYIYNGDANLKDNMKLTASQRITMQLPSFTIPEKLDIRTFGFSIAEPVDIDGNGYADIAVGAYKSGHAVILRSRPVVKTSLTIRTVPDTLQRNIRNFLVQVCVQYSGYDMARMQAFEISLTVDESHKRTEQTLIKLPSANISHDNCVNTPVTLSKNIQDFIEPITIYALHNFTHQDSRQSDFCPTCPVECKSDASKGTQALLSFDIGCGADRVCNSNISAIVRFSGVRQVENTNNDSWVIGSNDITLEASLTNHAEPAYLTTVAFILPRGIVLRSILPSCQEDTVGDNLTVTCSVGNPLGKDELKIVKLDLDMRHLTDGSLHGHVLEFITEIQTRSVNRGTRTIKSSLTLQSEAFLSLNGKANEESYYLPDLDKEQLNVSFQHTYLAVKSGATPIKEARLLVSIPTSVNGSSSLIFLHKPRIYIAGGYRDCSSHGIDVIDAQQNEHQHEIVSDTSEMNVPMFNNGTPPNVSHQLLKRDLSIYTNVAARLTQAVYNARTTNATGNLTRQDVVHLNCSTPSVNCSIVYCDLSELKTQQDVGKLVVKLILNATKLKDTIGLSDETKIVKFGTEAHVEIIQPADRIVSAEDTRRDMNLTTEFHSTEKTQELQLWVVLVSVSLGLILLCIVVILLCMTGFFKRSMKEELTALKENEMTENINKDEITDNSE